MPAPYRTPKGDRIAEILDAELEAEVAGAVETLSEEIEAGALVVVRTTNGGECVRVLAEAYRPTYGAVLFGFGGLFCVVDGYRISSVELLAVPLGRPVRDLDAELAKA